MPLPQFARFRCLGVEQGLSHGNAWHLMQDSRGGYIWVATFDGPNRYDGCNVTVFKYDSDDPRSLISIFTKHVSEDSTGSIWVGLDRRQ